MGGKYNSSHKKALKILSLHPEYIGLDKRDVLFSAIEPSIFYRGGFYAEPDLIFFMKRKYDSKLEKDAMPFKVIVIEYKSNGEKRSIEKGQSQLERVVDYYQKILKIPAEGRLITGTSYPILKNGKNSH